jgi:sulfhydrogenase subunit alpha
VGSETRHIAVDYVTRVEGEGRFRVAIRDGRVTESEFGIFEPPRFFEAFLQGRRFTEVPDITARICGICPVAYQMSSVQAMESACGATIDPAIDDLRKLMYCGEWIESHALHIHLLHAPDFLGYPSGIAMAADHPDAVTRGLRIKQIGNAIVSALGGREIHPVGVRVGGFHRVPSRAALMPLVDRLDQARDDAVAVVDWVASLPSPEVERSDEYVALSADDEYAVLHGRIRSTHGLDMALDEWNEVFVEEHASHSAALRSRIRERGVFQVGPLARFNLNSERLRPIAREAAARVGLTAPCTNPFRSIVVRAVEMLHAVDLALDLLDRYRPPAQPFVPVTPVASTGHGASEAPRGLLYHRYAIDDDGRILEAQIVPPTAQNQGAIEADLRGVVEANLDLADDGLRHVLEQAIRNYDPCISCATHFLDLEVDRGR